MFSSGLFHKAQVKPISALLLAETWGGLLQAYKRLSTLLEERSKAYANANARVSLESKFLPSNLLKVNSLEVYIVLF